eukprot:403376775
MACTKLGIDAKSELQIKNIEEFRKGNVEKEIVDIRYKHHLNRIRETLNQIIIERNKIQKSQQSDLQIGMDSKLLQSEMSHFQQRNQMNKNNSFLNLNQGQSERNGVISRASSHALLPSYRSQFKLPVNSLRQRNFKNNLMPSIFHTQSAVEHQNQDSSNQNISIISHYQQPTSLLNPSLLFRDLKVKILRNKEKEVILKKHQEKLIKTKENLDYQNQVFEVKKRKQEENREKHNERTYSNNSPLSLSKLNRSNNNLSDFEKFQVSYQQQQQRIQQILDNSQEMRKLQSIESKLHRSSLNYENELAQRRHKASERNRTQEDRFRQISEVKRKQDEENLIRLRMNQLNLEKKAQERSREQKEMDEYKSQQKAELKLKLMDNKKNEEVSHKSRLNTLLSKFEKTEQHRQELKQHLDYQNKIKQEKRKLKEDDTQITQERQKRQRQNQKMQILLKESEHEQGILMKQAQDEGIRRMKQELEMKVQIQKQKIRNNFSLRLLNDMTLRALTASQNSSIFNNQEISLINKRQFSVKAKEQPVIDTIKIKKATKSFKNEFMELTKFKLSMLNSLASYTMFFFHAPIAGVGLIPSLTFLFATQTIAMSTQAFGQVKEAERDALMIRTHNRPIPKETISSKHGCFIGTGLSVASFLAYLPFAPYTWMVSNTVWFSYLQIYLPMKQYSAWNTFFGAIVGALPPLIGTMAQLGTPFSVETMLLSAYIFSWQFPHFYGILYENKDDYKKAGFKMISNQDPKGQKAFYQILACSIFNTVVPLGFYTTGMISPLFLAPFYFYQMKYLKSVFDFRQSEATPQSAKKLKKTAYAPFVLLLLGFMATTGYKRYQKRQENIVEKTAIQQEQINQEPLN